jgi:porphobilinogen deaminase
LASLRAIDDSKLHREIDAERAYLAALGGGCDLPVGALCTTDSDGRLRLRAFLDTDAGPRRADVTGTDPTTLGRTAADAVRS